MAKAAMNLSEADPIFDLTQPDPILTLIEKHKEADRAYEVASAVCNQAQELAIAKGRGPIAPKEEKACWKACAVLDAAAWALVETPPTTVAGAAALLRYACDWLASPKETTNNNCYDYGGRGLMV